MAKKAAALRYNSDLPAPFLVARGRDELAERIVRLAEDSGIEIVSQPELTEKLFVLEPGTFIPEDCFSVVAEILAYVYAVQMNGRKADE